MHSLARYKITPDFLRAAKAKGVVPVSERYSWLGDSSGTLETGDNAGATVPVD